MNLKGIMGAAVASLGLAASTAASAAILFTVTGTSSLDGTFQTPSAPSFTSGGNNFYLLSYGTGAYADDTIVNLEPSYAPTLLYFSDGKNFTISSVVDPSHFDITGGGTLAIAGVPEPASWAVMIVGVGMAGAGLRLARRRKASALSPV